MKVRTKRLVGTRSQEVRPYETAHRQISRRAAVDGMVLLENRGGFLPLAPGRKVALYGAGAVVTVKGGTGSGDVNVRETVNVWQGLKNAGYEVTTQDWLSRYEGVYQKARLAWRDAIWDKIEKAGGDKDGLGFFYAYSTTPFVIPALAIEQKTDADTAVYVISRNAGEGADRHMEKGDWYLTDDETRNLDFINENYEHVVLVLNIGGLIDLSFTEKYGHIDSIIYMQQPGMEAGNAFADVFSGKVAPSAHLTDSWPVRYEDYPSAETFSHMNGNVDKEYYREGIYVGYRYFDTFDVPVRYPFGYGLSYTQFEQRVTGVEKSAHGIITEVLVKNIGKAAGRQVIQVYASCPQGRLDKEYRRLVGFAKTRLLGSGEEERLEIEFPLEALASYDEAGHRYILEKGIYGLFMGDDLNRSAVFARLVPDRELVTEVTENICRQQEQFDELTADCEKIRKRRAAWEQDESIRTIRLGAGDVQTRTHVYEGGYEAASQQARDFTEKLTVDQLIELSTGDVAKGQTSDPELGSAGSRVPGSAAQTSTAVKELGLTDIVLADGPAGLRLTKKYEVIDGVPMRQPISMSMEDGFLEKNKKEMTGDVYYQYCTAIPVGTCIANSWDLSLVRELGKLVAEEMNEFDVTLWLAPGMCIHRNPLCGRNFEYYSEDPFLSGMLASAMTEGVQSVHGCGTTIKHFACNNQEDNRMHVDSILTERALREIYIKGFEIAVRYSHPMALMTSYNKVNGIHAANCYDLCTKVVRDEWGYKGLIMTDWTTTMQGPDCTASGCMSAGNDVVMPGCLADHEDERKALQDGTLDLRDLKRSVSRIVDCVWNSNQYEV